MSRFPLTWALLNLILFDDLKSPFALNSGGKLMRKVSAGYFIITYFIAELSYAVYLLMDPFSIGSTAHFAHVGGFIAGAIIAGLFKAIKGDSYKTKKIAIFLFFCVNIAIIQKFFLECHTWKNSIHS